ncbi:hypothetical protein H4219_005085 [Mycoemilia scoparia]|uniref:DUF7707 domain-containing protein n=1 Tax=Mycoemilia scoparia TaxID=417184 RepID=A0A9W7ZV12_9FUNG|nr:hypothetical protein H4219_005085 [Mycoemilia scoparia]
MYKPLITALAIASSMYAVSAADSASESASASSSSSSAVPKPSPAPAGGSVKPNSVSNFDTDSISKQQRQSWCRDNKNFCQNLCLYVDEKAPSVKTCNSNSLSWDCACSNGTRPDPQVFTFPIPYYQCTTDVRKCQDKCKTNTACQENCATSRNCTAPKDPNNGRQIEDVPSDEDDGNVTGDDSGSKKDGSDGSTDGDDNYDPFHNNPDAASTLYNPLSSVAVYGGLVASSLYMLAF